jgi:cob(I)alamin adenosyltransferase
MLYTRKGDGGTTKTFSCDQRISKSSAITEALGTLDEANSHLGLVRACCLEQYPNFLVINQTFADVILFCQQNLFIIQAEVAGAPGKTIDKAKVVRLEEMTDFIEKKIPQIKTFLIPGSTKLSALFDVSRTIVRKAERRVVAVHEEGILKIGEFSLSYLNRLSSLLYAMARYSNCLLKVKEETPNYK